jgi:hypothetical protein
MKPLNPFGVESALFDDNAGRGGEANGQPLRGRG